MAIIRIVDLKVRAIIGTYPWERKNKQDLVINITIEYDASKASKSDDLSDALDYERVANKVVSVVEGSNYHLLEKLGLKLLAVVLSDKKAASVTVKLDKPHALPTARYISYEISGRN